MTTEPMPEPEGPEDERFVYMVTAEMPHPGMDD